MAPSTSTAATATSPIPAPVNDSATPRRRGFTAAIAAFVIWGMFPLYLLGLKGVGALEITSHRIVWSCVFVLAWMAVRGELPQLREAFARKGVLLRLAASAFFISVNWLGFVWAVNQHRVLEVSLGYYIGPLVSVLLGVFVLSERLNRAQWVAVSFAAVGVAYLTFATEHAPWIALLVASSFALYGLIRKTVSVDALPGLAIETILLVPFALGYLIWAEMNGAAVFTHSGGQVDAFLMFGGVITAVPLFLFSYGARRIPLSTAGIIQFIGPTLQLLTGLLVFGEPFPLARAAGFAMIWIGVAIYAAHGLWTASRPRVIAQEKPSPVSG